MAPAPGPELEVLPFATAGLWERWLDEHHDTAPGVWVKIAKKGSAIPGVSYAESVEVALCFGWIDGMNRRFDEQFYLQRFTPRTPRSSWSAGNRALVARLTEQGRMRPAGLAAVERAKANGRWDGEPQPPAHGDGRAGRR